ncbi:histidine phosphatase family protein [bacterium]|nr:histidine phosphatase family protein [bacterium]
MKIYLVRHGETFDNVSGFVAGHLPGKLTENGRKQVIKTGERIENIKFDRIFCSDLARTRETLDGILSQLKFESNVEYLEQLRERFFGEYEGFYQDEFEWNKETLDSLRYPKNGESCEDLLKRAKQFHESLSDLNFENILVVSHCLFLKAFLCAHNGSGLDEYFTMKEIPNASITIIEI